MRLGSWSKSLRVRYGTFAAGLTLLIIVVHTTVSATVDVRSQTSSTLALAKATAAVAAAPIVATYNANVGGVGFQLTKAMKSLKDDLPLFASFQIVTKRGDVAFDSRSFVQGTPEALDPADITRAVSANELTDRPNPTATIIYAPYFDSNGSHTHTVRFEVETARTRTIVSRSIAQAVIAIIVFVPLGFMVFYWLTHRLIVAAVEQIRSDMNLITSGDTDRRVHLKRHDEFGQLADSLNTMAYSILENVKALEEEKAWKNEFIILASHNLRTPLSVIMSSIASLKKLGGIGPEAQKFIDYIYSRGKELHGLIENLLSISTLKGGRLEAADEPYDLMEVVNAVAKDQEARLKERALTLTIETRANHIIARGDRDQMYQVLDNLVDNAIKFTQTGGITLRLDDSKEKINLSVIDTGAGIEESMIHKLFESFRRGANPMSVDHKGAGLGLYFVKLAVESQGGEISIKSQPGRGTQVNLILPKG